MPSADAPYPAHMTIKFRGPKAMSGLGLVAILLGVLACITCWIPILGLISLPLSGLGLLFGVVGCAVSIAGRRSGISLPLAGTVVCVVAIVLALWPVFFLGAAATAGVHEANRKSAAASGGATPGRFDERAPLPSPKGPKVPTAGSVQSPQGAGLAGSVRGGATETSAPPLKNGILVDNDLSITVAKFERHHADGSPQQGIFTRDVEGAYITLAFRRIDARWPTESGMVMTREFRVIITDDRGNEYEGLNCLQGSRVLYGGPFCLDGTHIMYGTPSRVQQMPVGFTWTGILKVKMPQNAPISKVELERKRFGGTFQNPDTRRYPMNTGEPAAADFEFDIPPRLLLSEGTNIETGRDVRAGLGHLSVRDSYTIREHSGYGQPKNEKGLSLSLPIEVTNMDYNPRTVSVPRLSVQFENGEVIERSEDTVIQSAQLQDNPDFLGGSLAFDVPGKSVHTLILRVDVAESMNAELGLNVRRILLYAEDGFEGFVQIPDDARQRIVAIARGESEQAIGEDSRAGAHRPTSGPSVVPPARRKSRGP